MGPETEIDLFPKVSRERRGTVSREVSRNCSVLGGVVWMKKVLRGGIGHQQEISIVFCFVPLDLHVSR